MNVLSHEAGALSGEPLHIVNEMKSEYTRGLMDILAGIEETHGPAHANRRVAAYSLFGMMNWMITGTTCWATSAWNCWRRMCAGSSWADTLGFPSRSRHCPAPPPVEP